MEIKKLRFLFFFVLHVSLSFNVSAIKRDVKDGDTLFAHKDYYKAIEVYKAELEKGNDPEIKAKLADCYRFTNNTLAAEKIYAELVNSPDDKPIYSLYYADCLKNNGKITEAKNAYGEYLRSFPNDKSASSAFKSCAIYSDSASLISCADLKTQPSLVSFDAPDFTKTFIPITLDASKINAGKDSISEYFWDFDDRTIALGKITNHKFSENRTYAVKLIITTQKTNGTASIYCGSKVIDVRPNFKPGNNLLEIQKQGAENRQQKTNK